MTKQEIFKNACYSNNLKDFWISNILSKNISIQNFFEFDMFGELHNPSLEYIVDFITKENLSLNHRIFNPDDLCISCEEKIQEKDFDIHSSYWTNLWRPIHKKCKSEYEKEEKYVCQCIDADCNDCKFFIRKGKTNKGNCDKFYKEVTAHPNTATGHECFEHRDMMKGGMI